MDKEQTWLQVTSGQSSPEECQWVVARVIEEIIKEAAEASLTAAVLDEVEGDRRGIIKSATLSIYGKGSSEFISSWTGTVQWIGKSQYRPNHKRKNWFIGIETLTVPETPAWSLNDIRVDTFRSSGPGGQHVNKTDSAVRITHIPTGITASSQSERSQHANRRLALARLASAMQEREDSEGRGLELGKWGLHSELVRGNPIRVYEGEKFRRKQ